MASPNADADINFGMVFSEINSKTHLGMRDTQVYILQKFRCQELPCTESHYNVHAVGDSCFLTSQI